MSKENITIQDCLDLYYKKGYITVIENGQVVEFKEVKEDECNNESC